MDYADAIRGAFDGFEKSGPGSLIELCAENAVWHGPMVPQ
jgi:hypothetical protein